MPASHFREDILVEHLDELTTLWPVWTDALSSPSYTLHSLRFLEERLEAHEDGLTIAGATTIPVLSRALASDDDWAVTAAARIALTLGTASALEPLTAMLKDPEGKAFDATLQALRLGPIGPLETLLREAGSSPNAALAASALAVLARHGSDADFSALPDLIDSDDPRIRARALEAAAHQPPCAVTTKQWQAALEHDPLSETALLGATWTRQPWLAQTCGRLGTSSLQCARTLAIVGAVNELKKVQELVQTRSLGPRRFGVASSFGHPELIPLLIGALSDSNPADAAAAAEAFERMTGERVLTSERVPVSTVQVLSEVDRELVEEVNVPDAARARHVWDNARAKLGKAVRLYFGEDIATLQTAGVRFDMRARQELALRERYHGRWKRPLFELTAFPYVT